MIRISVDSSILNSLENYRTKMLPYMARNTLNRTMRQVQDVLKRDIPARFPGRGGMGWMMKGLQIQQASTSNLSAAVYFEMAQSHLLYLHETGGIKTPKGAHFAIPIAPELRQPGKRIPQQLMPKWLLGARAGQGFRPGHEAGGGHGPLPQFFERMAKRAKGKRIRNVGKLASFQTGFLLESNGKTFIVTRPSKGVLKFWYYLAPLAHIRDLLKFKETAAAVASRNMQANFQTAVGEINRAFERNQAVKG